MSKKIETSRRTFTITSETPESEIFGYLSCGVEPPLPHVEEEKSNANSSTSVSEREARDLVARKTVNSLMERHAALRRFGAEIAKFKKYSSFIESLCVAIFSECNAPVFDLYFLSPARG